jgi:hypothetical protein
LKLWVGAIGISVGASADGLNQCEAVECAAQYLAAFAVCLAADVVFMRGVAAGRLELVGW